MVFRQYSQELMKQGMSASAAQATVATIRTVSDRAEIERWNQILTSDAPRFNTAPNAFLVDMTKGLTPGRLLDVGMGQGRNTIYLAQQGWDSVGFDPAERAVEAARVQASKLGVRITATVAKDSDYDSGTAQ